MVTDRKRRAGSGLTIRDVAALAGTSAMTVSNVVNGTGKVGEATRCRVEAAIRQTGYVPNAAARRLASPGSSRLAVLYTRPSSAFVSAALVGAVTGTSRSGVQLVAHDCGDADYDALGAAMEELVGSGVAGLLLLPPFAEMASRQSSAAGFGVPVAAISTGTALPGMLTVRIDEQAAAMAVLDLLLARGHRRIAFVKGPPSHSGSLERRRGFEAAMARHRLTVPEELVADGDYDFASGMHAAERLLGLADRPTAIFACNDEMAAGVAWTAHRLGVAIPHELAIAGFDDSPLAERVFPPLTAVRQPVARMAERATELLLEAMRGGTAPAHDEVVEFTLIERGSTAAEAALEFTVKPT
jgi:LacI family transcriptional regulator